MSSAGKVIKCKAAVAWGVNQPLVVEDIEVAPPKAREVRIKMISASICHTEFLGLNGSMNTDFPIILGHEGAGIVESVGEGVTSLREGDHVIPLPIKACGKCKYCKSPDTTLCAKLVDDVSSTSLRDGTKRFTCRGTPVGHFFTVSTFSQYTVCPESDVAKVMKDAPLDKICVIGCAIPTGFGAAVNTAKVKAGSTCAVWGLGGVGLAAVMGCRNSGASRIIAIDVNPDKYEYAKKFGATEFINPNDYSKPIQEVITELTDGGCDYTFECIGNVKTMEAAFESSHKGWGKTIVMGAVGLDYKMIVNPFDFIWGKQITGSTLGDYKCEDITKLVEMYMNKEILVDELITAQISLKDINVGLDWSKEGKGIRTTIRLFEE